jgi:hypothetical protein
MSFTEQSDKIAVWYLRLSAGDRSVTVTLNEHLYAGADEVLSVSEEVLFGCITFDNAPAEELAAAKV